MDLKLGFQLVRNMGKRYILYRLRHEVEKKLGVLKRIHPTNLQFKHTISLAEWKATKGDFLVRSRDKLSIQKNRPVKLKSKANRILDGELPFFNADWIKIGKDYDWLTNPSNNYRYNKDKH